MATSNFTKLRERTSKAYGHIKDLSQSKTKKLLLESLVMQTQIKEQFSSIKKDYSKNKTIYSLLYKEVMLLRKKKDKPKFDKIKSIFDRDRSGKSGGGLFGSLLSALGTAGMILKPLLSKLTKDIAKMTKGLAGSMKKMLKSMGGVGNKVIQGVGRSTVGRAVGAAAVNVGKGIGRVAVGTVARFIGAGVVGAAASAVGYPLLIASAAAAVGYGTYKLGRYLKLSEKLDDFIKKVSSGKYRDIGDFILGMVDGTLGKDLYVWVKDKISSLFTDAIVYLKDKTNDILGKWSPFINDADTQAGGAEEDVNSVEENANSGNAGNSEPKDPSTNANDEFRQTLAGGSAGMQTDMLGAAKAYTNDTPIMMQGVDGYSGSSNSAPAGGAAAGSLAYHALTNGANTTITSRFGKRKGSSKVSSNHTGLDIDAKMGTPLYAPESGRVTQSKHEMGGLQAHLTGKSGVVYGLAHLSSVNAKGEVKAGDLIAKSGNSGKGTTAPHIHLSITHNNKKVNPEGFRIPKRKGSNDSGGAKGIGGTGNDNGAKHAEFGISESSPAAASMRSNVSAVSGGKTYETAAGFSALTSSTGPSVESSLSSSPGISAAKRSSVKSSSPQSASSNASSKAGSIEGKTPNIKDPRGALNQDVMQAATSPLFV